MDDDRDYRRPSTRTLEEMRELLLRRSGLPEKFAEMIAELVIQLVEEREYDRSPDRHED